MNDVRVENSSHPEFSVEVSANLLRRARAKLSSICSDTFRPSELCLAIASGSGGGFLAALRSGVGPQSSLWWLFYGVLPAFGLAGVVAYVLLKRLSSSQPAALAHELLEDLPDPDQTAPLFEETDRLKGTWKLESTTVTSGKSSTGVINFDVAHGRIVAAGLIYGQSDAPIGDISSVICDYQPRTKQLVLVYRLSAYNDDGSQLIALCILSGILFENSRQGEMLIRGNWFHLQGGPTGTRPSGTATLTLSPAAKSLAESP